MSEFTYETASADETRALGARIAALLEAGDVVLLHGDLGAGKTTITQGIGSGLGTARLAQSPTFSLVVDTPLPNGSVLRHIDLYRLNDLDELEALGFEDLTNDDSAITLVEWPERATGMLPERYLLIELEPSGTDRRSIRLRPFGLGDRFAEELGVGI
ncbi:MAG: tRNA (adenosine(37)-N6)-threonylcarbamoyltransferase complex ATPase subunit type 1 TsaE [Thermomicrobiales bacterium]|nr:tRNA (adenosine(37)-N6)-threonylcarbamoyltransferase complex ATPase subunit type 1 TsaE [Thermomicrobiales bacterium]